MFINSPIFLLSILIMTCILLIRKCIIDHKFYKEILIINFVLIFCYSMIIVFFNEIKNNNIGYMIYTYSSLGILLLISLFFYVVLSSNLNKKSFLNNILNSLDDNTYYLLLDKKNRIEEISVQLCNVFGVEKDKIINESFLKVLNENITIENINGKMVSNNEFILYIKDQIPKELHSRLEITFIRKDGKEKVITLTESSIYVGDKFYGRMYIGDISKITNDIPKIAIDSRFDLLMSISDYGIFNYDFNNKNIIVNDYIVHELNLVGNSISLTDLLYNLNRADYDVLKSLVNNVNRSKPTFNTVLQYNLDNGNEVFLKVSTAIIFDGINKKQAIGTISISSTKQFFNTNSSILDNIKPESNLAADIKHLVNNSTKFEVVTFKIMDIKNINNEYNRQVGTLIIEEYIRSIINAFDLGNNIYRSSGTRFTFLLTDSRYMEKLTRSLNNNKLLTPTLSYGRLNIKLNVVMGISFSNDSIRKDEIYLNSKYALNKAIENKQQYVFYKDLIE